MKDISREIRREIKIKIMPTPISLKAVEDEVWDQIYYLVSLQILNSLGGRVRGRISFQIKKEVLWVKQ
jgi:hypothetical protein